VNIDTWNGCYPSKWKGIITPEAFAHPAKFSSKLIERIYQHAIEEGWLKPGDNVVDPFGGVALGAFPALRMGLNWSGCELEQRFVDLGRANIALWNNRYRGRLPRWGTAQLLQGDSRNLAQVVGAAQAAVSSPPYADGCAHTGGNDRDGKLQGGTYYGVGINGVVSSPPYADRLAAPTDVQGYEAGTLKMNEGQTYQGVISSPPYADSINANAAANDSEARAQRKAAAGVEESAYHRGEPNSVQNRPQVYGATPGQLGAMPAGDYRAAITSPPFEDQEAAHSARKYSDPEKVAEEMAQKYANGTFKGHAASKEAILRSLQSANNQTYGDSPGQLGTEQGETFWTAAREIVEQVYQVLALGGHSIWVVKGFVKNKSYVDFPGQWRELCESVGFESLHEHRAMLVNHKGTSLTIEGDEVQHITESKSFFRRLAEKNGSPRIDWESVLCMVKQ